ncbi:MAG: hypothetical protein R3301_16775 [Saprospiraceae bacterium]|nr:hypothetical protein [Saprospiraceae bacterium]
MTKHVKFFNLAVIAILFSAITFTGCDKDDPPTTATLFGTITIDNVELWETWQDSGEVQLTLFPEFSLDPPAGWGPIPDGYFGPGTLGGTFALGAPVNAQNPIVLEYAPGVTQWEFEITVDPGTYSALALGFRHDFINDPSLRSATLGVHWNNPSQVSHGIVIRVPGPGGQVIPVYNEPAPATFTVNAGDKLDVSFRADFGFVEDWY